MVRQYAGRGSDAHHPGTLLGLLIGPVPQDPLQAMAHRLKTRAGRALYALRKSTIEPVIGLGHNQERLPMCSHRPFMMASPTGC